MRVAQNLYEAGAITYMRTDGVQMDSSAVADARRAISERFDGHYIPETPRIYQTKAKNAQEAHEAIRPVDFAKDHYGPSLNGGGDEGRLYDLIYKRAMASQMASASLERTTITLADPAGRHELRATGQVIKFPGFLAVYEEGRITRRIVRTTNPACCLRWPGAIRPPSARSMRPSTSPSRRRAFPRHRWSSGWKNSASAAFDLCLDLAGAQGSQLCPHREKPFLCRGIGAFAHGFSRTLLPALCRL